VEPVDVFVEELVAALAIAPPPPTRTPVTTIAPMAFLICICMSLTSFPFVARIQQAVPE
jgi:hypothetical protein